MSLDINSSLCGSYWLFVYDCASLNYVVVQVLVSPEGECHVSSFLSVPDDGHAGNAFSAADMSCCQQK